MVHLIKDEKGYSIGWEFRPITEEEQKTAGIIRDLQFFGFDDTAIAYNGITLIDQEKGKQLGNIKSVSWLQKQHHKKWGDVRD
jgi:hypothetical protein